MSIFKPLRGNGSNGTNGNGNTNRGRAENFFGEVVGFNTAGPGPQTVTVKHALTGEQRTVALDPEAKITNIKEGYERPAISKFEKSGKSKTDIGGVLRIESARLDNDSGLWMARWVSSAVHKPGEGYVQVAKEARVGALQSGPTKPYRAVDILSSESATRVTTAEQLRAAVTAAVSDPQHGGAYVRALIGGKVGGVLLSGGNISAPDGERVERALSRDSATDVLNSMSALKPGDVLEVVPAKRLFFGGDTATNAKLDKMFTNTVTDADGSDNIYSKGFTSVMLTVRTRDDGSEFVIGAMPSENFPNFSRVGDFNADGAANAEFVPESGSAIDESEVPDFDIAELAQSEAAPARRASGPGMG